MKIACIAYFHGFGGAERQIIMLANNLAERGHDVSLITLAANNSVYEVSSKINFIDLSGFEKKCCKIAKRYIRLRSVLKQIKPNVNINFWLQSAYLCTLMPKSICGRIIYAERGDPGDKEYAYILGLIRYISFKRIDGFVFQSNGARDYFKNSVKIRSVVIPNAHSIPDGIFTEICSRREQVIVSVGRLHPQKNQALLIKAFAKIANNIPSYTLEIYGDGDLHDELIELVKELGMEKRIFIHPSCRNIFEIVHSASLFVLSSDFEGMPNALLEALALGTPCISTDCKPGGARELIDDGVNGWIVPRNDCNALADKIESVLNDCDKRKEVVEECVKVRRKYSKEEIYLQWSNFINKMVL